MKTYIVARIAQTLVALVVITIIVSLLVRAAGDPTMILLPMDASPEDRDRLRHDMGLDKPLYLQYLIFMGNVFKGDFGTSTQFRQPALKSVLERFPATLQLASLSMVGIMVIGVPAGVYAALKRGSLSDWAIRFFALLGNSFPSFWLGIILMLLFAVWLKWLPPGGKGTPQHLVLPTVTLAWYLAGGVTRLVRSNMLEVLGRDFIRTARAKGLSGRAVTWRHAFRNALLPVVTYTGVIFLRLIAGTVVVETVFGWPGVGRAVVTSVAWRDYPMVQTVVILLGAIVLIGNLVVDILYYYIDPRLRRT